ncbi:putative amidase [Cyphellophora attinorum]|uniref:amidase n=1 Tax=Cyphellophora attinorum TaxID=1664694 RepID=A0A0N1H929_9EURO|nr:putative amidase [Phialophora attinorum]KPI43877.1 putative amidase [Phialophora attinorum]
MAANPVNNTMDFPFSASEDQSAYITDSSAPWVAIAKRKRKSRDDLIPSKWRLPASAIPKDPPSLAKGPQSVHHIPREHLSSAEVEITEGYTAQSLLDAVQRKKYTAVQVAEAFCHRAAIAQQLTNCLTEPLFSQAIERAKFLDKYLTETGQTLGPLHGLPMTVKDTFDYAGVDTSVGLASLCFKPAQKHSPMVEMLLSLGAIIVAKTNVPQTMQTLDSVNNVFGRTMNPSNRLITAGGSSGGEGVMVGMKGCMIGIGTDIGGSIRVPAYVNGVVGFKPSEGRMPYGGQVSLGVEGMSRCGVQAVAGPIARSVADIDFLMSVLVPQTHLWGEDCVFGSWTPSSSTTETPLSGSGPKGELVIGILRSDGNCTPLPPIDNILTEVSSTISSHPNILTVELPTPPAWTKSQSVMSKIMSIEGGKKMSDVITATKEPMVPWMSTRFKVGGGKPRDLLDVAAIQNQRTELEKEMSKLWYTTGKHGRRRRAIDAIICPLAPHPPPPIEGYNAVGYTSSFVLFDYPAGALPVRDIREGDLQLGKEVPGKAVSSWDERSRELWDEGKLDRRVYLGTKLSVQVVTPRLEDERLCRVMGVLEGILQSTPEGQGRASKL